MISFLRKMKLENIAISLYGIVRLTYDIIQIHDVKNFIYFHCMILILCQIMISTILLGIVVKGVYNNEYDSFYQKLSTYIGNFITLPLTLLFLVDSINISNFSNIIAYYINFFSIFVMCWSLF